MDLIRGFDEPIISSLALLFPKWALLARQAAKLPVQGTLCIHYLTLSTWIYNLKEVLKALTRKTPDDLRGQILLPTDRYKDYQAIPGDEIR